MYAIVTKKYKTAKIFFIDKFKPTLSESIRANPHSQAKIRIQKPQDGDKNLVQISEGAGEMVTQKKRLIVTYIGNSITKQHIT